MKNSPPKHAFKKHPHFDLMLPSNETLQEYVGAAVIERSVRHEWPLSCVEFVIFDGGVKKYCKTLRPPSMEIAAYRSLKSPLLVQALLIAESADSGALLLDSFDGKHLTKEVVRQNGFVTFVDSLKEQVSTIQGVGPAFVDFSTVDKVKNKMSEMLDRVRRRFGPNAPGKIDSGLIELAERCVASREVQDSFIEDAIYTNGDLSAANILISDNDLRIIDWQFPRAVGARIDRYVLGDAESIPLDTRYNLIGGGPGWSMVETQGFYARAMLRQNGITAYVAYGGEHEGRHKYSIGKLSMADSFPIVDLYAFLNELEGFDSATGSCWGEGIRSVGHRN